jgi:signal transduction histidine kinase
MFRTLKDKFRAIYIVLISCVLLVGAVSTISLSLTGKNVDTMIEKNYKIIQAVDEMLEIVDRQDSAVLTYLSIDTTKGITIFTEGMQDFLKALYVVQENLTEKELAYADEIAGDYDAYCKDFSLLQEEQADYGVERAIAYYDENMTPKFTNLKENIRNLRDDNIDEMLERRDEVSSQTRILGIGILALTLVLAFVAYLFSVVRVQKILAPLYLLTDNIKSVSADGFNQHLETNSSGEIKELETEFNRMITRLQDYDQDNISQMIAQKQKLESIIDNLEDPFLLLSHDYLIEAINPSAERLFSVSGKWALGRHVLELIRDDSFFELVRAASQKDAPRQEQMLLFGDPPRIYQVIVTGFLSGGEEKLEVLLQDVTSVTETEKIRTDFIATVSHELKTPLTTILMGTSMLSSNTLGQLNDEQQEVVDAINDDVGCLSRLIEDLLELTKIQSGNVSYHMEPTSLLEVSSASVALFSERSKYSGVSLENRMDQTIPPVIADSEKLIWVFNNILNNAFKYTKPQDSIVIFSDWDESFVFVHIKDSGLGIPKENLQRIFESDFHYHENNVEDRSSGIGLYLSKNIIEAHQGTITVKSELNQGSEFIFSLPRFYEEESK